MFTRVKTAAEVEVMRQGGKMLATVLQIMRERCKPGMTPKDMAQIARRELKALGGEPAFLGFYGYPDVMCISVNEQVQHTIPDDRPFQPGDVVNFDFGVTYKGLVTDAGIMVCVDDKWTPETKRLLDGTRLALEAGLAVVRDGCRVGDVSAAVEKVLRAHKLGIVRELVGHGVGDSLHEEPEIANYGKAGTGPVLKAGMTIAIEPIATLGSPKLVEAHDGWTLLAADGSWAAQFEHTVAVTKDGCDILTQG